VQREVEEAVARVGAASWRDKEWWQESVELSVAAGMQKVVAQRAAHSGVTIRQAASAAERIA
jgi:hypothetical protein